MRARLLVGASNTVSLISTGLVGTTGLGKSTAAMWAANDLHVQTAFAGGVVWLRFGQSAVALGQMMQLAHALKVTLDERVRQERDEQALRQALKLGAGGQRGRRNIPD